MKRRAQRSLWKFIVDIKMNLEAIHFMQISLVLIVLVQLCGTIGKSHVLI